MNSGIQVTCPAVAVEHVLRARFSSYRPIRDADELINFQRDAVAQLCTILQQRRGAILADSVGLGKTHVAAAVARLVAKTGVLVVAPSHLRMHWLRHLHRVPHSAWLSHASLSRGRTSRVAADLLIVDEAHAFRNPSTARYRTLSRLTRHTRILMLTATPVNNSVMDFYHLVRLFASRDAFFDIGVPDLWAAIAGAAQGDSAAAARVVEAVVVRRTRAAIRIWGAQAHRFPRSDGVQVLDYGTQHGGLVEHLLASIERVNFAGYVSENDVVVAPLLMRLGLVKRLESSIAAFDASLRRYIAILQHVIAAAERNLLFSATRDADLLVCADRFAQLPLQELLLRPWPPTRNRAATIASARAELQLLNQARSMCASMGEDAKLARLRQLLSSHVTQSKVVIFTEYRETAEYLWRNLSRTFPVGMVHGGSARLGLAAAARSAVLERFAETARRRVPVHEEIRVLIATDVIAEGTNLQQARVVVSYDLPWNPVRLAQRVGRIDRLGSPHDEVLAYTFRPAAAMHAVTRVLHHMRRKIREIRAIGGDAPRVRSAKQYAHRIMEDERRTATETLRRRFTEMAPNGGVEQHQNQAVAVMAAAADASACDAVLTCWRTAAAVRFTLTRGGRTLELSAGAVDPLLLRLARIDTVGRIDAHRVDRAVVQARRTLQHGYLPSATTSVLSIRIAKCVQRWLREQGPVPSASQMQLADRVLCAAQSLSAADEEEIAALLGTATPAAVVQRLSEMTSSAHAHPPNRAELIAAFQFSTSELR